MKTPVLVIDTEGLLPRALDELLDSQGHEVERFDVGSAALSGFTEAHHPVIFISLNSTESWELMRQLRSRMRWPCHIFVVGPDQVSTAVRAMQAGARQYWPSPLNMAEVEARLQDGSFKPQSSNQRYQREGTLLQVIKEIALTMELDGLVNILMDSAMELADADGGVMMLLDERTQMLSMKAIRGMSGNEGNTEYFGLDENGYQEIMSGKTPVLLTPEQPMVASNQQKIAALIAVPIWWKEEALGMLVVTKFAGENGASFSNDEYKLLALLVEEIAGAVFNAVTHYRTKELTIKDDLTDAYNRRYFERYLEDEFMRARRYSSNLSLIFFDVDNLKEVNLHYGHLIGSKTLQEVAHRMILTVRGIDKVVRYGGDEFCVVLPETDTQGAYQVAERIRTIVASKPFLINDNIPVTITGSIGIASFPSHASTKDELVRQADKAMFVIKNKSKNAIGVAEVLA